MKTAGLQSISSSSCLHLCHQSQLWCVDVKMSNGHGGVVLCISHPDDLISQSFRHSDQMNIIPSFTNMLDICFYFIQGKTDSHLFLQLICPTFAIYLPQHCLCCPTFLVSNVVWIWCYSLIVLIGSCPANDWSIINFVCLLTVSVSSKDINCQAPGPGPVQSTVDECWLNTHLPMSVVKLQVIVN